MKRHKLRRSHMHGVDGLDAYHMQNGNILAVLLRERSDTSGNWTVLVWQDCRRGDGIPIGKLKSRRVDARRMAEAWVRAQATARDEHAALLSRLESQGFVVTPTERFGGFVG